MTTTGTANKPAVARIYRLCSRRVFSSSLEEELVRVL